MERLADFKQSVSIWGTLRLGVPVCARTCEPPAPALLFVERMGGGEKPPVPAILSSPEA